MALTSVNEDASKSGGVGLKFFESLQQGHTSLSLFLSLSLSLSVCVTVCARAREHSKTSEVTEGVSD